MKTIFILALIMCSSVAHSQQQTFDIFTFTPPKTWSKSVKENSILYTFINNQQRTWAQIDLLKSTTSKGSIAADFESEWKELVAKRYGVVGKPLGIDSQSFQGYKLWTGLGKFVFNKDTASVLLNTFSNGVRCASFLLLSNTTAYGKTLDKFVASVNLAKPNAVPQKNPVVVNTPSTTGFQFNTTNFDDGWTSVVKEEWVEANKGNVKVLLHYPRKEDEKYFPDRLEQVNTFWNLLVAPRYSNLRNYETPINFLAETAFFASGLVQEQATGKDVWVTLFKKGKTGWIEIITPDKQTFVNNFRVNSPDAYFNDWDLLVNLSGLNRFALGENDLVGKWSNQFTGSTAYYGLYTGVYAGSSTYASEQNFVFERTKTYKWNLVVGQSGINTTMQVDKANASGTYKLLNNWQVWFSEIERRPKTYNAYFSCIKGARILWLQDVEYGSYTAYGKVSK